MIHLVELCECVCLHDNLKTIADIYFLLGSYRDWRKKSQMNVHAKVINRSIQGFELFCCS